MQNKIKLNKTPGPKNEPSCCKPCVVEDDCGRKFVAIATSNEIIYIRPDEISWDYLTSMSHKYVRDLEPGESFEVVV